MNFEVDTKRFYSTKKNQPKIIDIDYYGSVNCI